MEADAKARAESAARETAAWEAVKNNADRATLQAFLRDWPEGAHADEAKRLRRAMDGGTQDRTWLIAATIYALAALPAAFLASYWLFGFANNLDHIVFTALPPLMLLLIPLALRHATSSAVERALFWVGALPLLGWVYLFFEKGKAQTSADPFLFDMLLWCTVLFAAPVLLNWGADRPSLGIAYTVHWIGICVMFVLAANMPVLPLAYLAPVQAVSGISGLPLGMTVELILAILAALAALLFGTIVLRGRRRREDIHSIATSR